MAKSFIIILAAVGVIAFSISALAFSSNDISLNLPELAQSDSLDKQSILNEIEQCLENNLAGGTITLNSFNTNMLMTLKQSVMDAKNEESLLKIKNTLSQLSSCGT